MDESSAVSVRSEKKRAQIRNAAKQLFLQAGFQSTSTDTIMAAAGIASKETLYRYYAKKEDLFVDALRSVTTERLHLQPVIERPTSPANLAERRMCERWRL